MSKRKTGNYFIPDKKTFLKWIEDHGGKEVTYPGKNNEIIEGWELPEPVLLFEYGGHSDNFISKDLLKLEGKNIYDEFFITENEYIGYTIPEDLVMKGIVPKMKVNFKLIDIPKDFEELYTITKEKFFNVQLNENSRKNIIKFYSDVIREWVKKGKIETALAESFIIMFTEMLCIE